jgi:hypothetical protein
MDRKKKSKKSHLWPEENQTTDGKLIVKGKKG